MEIHGVLGMVPNRGDDGAVKVAFLINLVRIAHQEPRHASIIATDPIATASSSSQNGTLLISIDLWIPSFDVESPAFAPHSWSSDLPQ